MLQEKTEQLKQDVLTRMPKSIVETFHKDIAQLKTDRLKEKALQVGDQIPNSILLTNLGDKTDLKSYHTSDYLLLNFYRGGWCPYCNMELREYQNLQDQFKSVNTNIIAISAELPVLTTDTSKKNHISYPILTDLDAVFMQKIGIVFTLSKEAKKDFEGFGMDFKSIQGNDYYQLPVPAIYLIDRNFQIVYRHFEEDYMTRLEPSTLLSKIKNNNF